MGPGIRHTGWAFERMTYQIKRLAKSFRLTGGALATDSFLYLVMQKFAHSSRLSAHLCAPNS